MTIINIFIIVVLLMFAAFFVVCEFSIVKVSQVRLDYLEAQGNKKAKWLQQITNNLDGYLSATQLGVTLTSLGLGWIGESTVEHLLHPLFVEMGLSSAL
ncbi:MAG TPA: CNNM domain-containing protein, partial [Bacillales bacterium]